MSALPSVRVVMEEAEYKCERQRLQDLYGDPDGHIDTIAAKRDQAFAELFYRSGWTQAQLAVQEGKAQPWVTYRLRLGRFLAYATNITAVITIPVWELTEWRFRGYWERTEKGDEDTRFDAVIRMMQPGASAPEPKPTKSQWRKPSPQREKARDIIRPMVEAGETIRTKELAARPGMPSEIVIRETAAQEIGRAQGLHEAAEAAKALNAPIDTSSFSKTAQEKFDTAVRRRIAQLDAEFADRVQAEVTRHINEYVLPRYKERLEKAELVLKAGKPFTTAQWNVLMRALHTDTHAAGMNTERLQEAFTLMRSKADLLRPPEMDRPFTSTLPTSLAELIARKKTRK